MFFLQTSVMDKTGAVVVGFRFCGRAGLLRQPAEHRSLTEQRVLGYNKAVWPPQQGAGASPAYCATEVTNVTKWKIGVLGAGTGEWRCARMLCERQRCDRMVCAGTGDRRTERQTAPAPNLPGMPQTPGGDGFLQRHPGACTGKDVLPFARSRRCSCGPRLPKAPPFVPEGQVIVDVAKGIEPGTLLTMTEVLADEARRAAPRRCGW